MDGNLLYAFCTVSEKKYDIRSHFSPWIGFVYTFPEYRGRHYAGLLLRYAEKEASARGFKTIYLSTKHIGFYEKYGYEFQEMMTDWRGDEQRVYRKKVRESDMPDTNLQ